MKKLYIIFMAFLAAISAVLFFIQYDSTAISIIFLVMFIASIVLALVLAGIFLDIYFETLYVKIKWPFIYLGMLAIIVYPISLIGRFELPEQLGVYAYMPLLVAFVFGNIFYVQIITILKREKVNYDVTWTKILFDNEKVKALETESEKNASTKLYQVALVIVLAGTITATKFIVLIAAFIGIVVAFKYFKKAAVFLKTKAYIITEIIYFGSIVLAAVVFYVTEHQSVLFYPVIGFIVFKITYYNAVKQKVSHEKTRAY